MVIDGFMKLGNDKAAMSSWRATREVGEGRGDMNVRINRRTDRQAEGLPHPSVLEKGLSNTHTHTHTDRELIYRM